MQRNLHTSPSKRKLKFLTGHIGRVINSTTHKLQSPPFNPCPERGFISGAPQERQMIYLSLLKPIDRALIQIDS
jgi:hypothetical protein